MSIPAHASNSGTAVRIKTNCNFIVAQKVNGLPKQRVSAFCSPRQRSGDQAQSAPKRHRKRLNTYHLSNIAAVAAFQNGQFEAFQKSESVSSMPSTIIRSPSAANCPSHRGNAQMLTTNTIQDVQADLSEWLVPEWLVRGRGENGFRVPYRCAPSARRCVCRCSAAACMRLPSSAMVFVRRKRGVIHYNSSG